LAKAVTAALISETKVRASHLPGKFYPPKQGKEKLKRSKNGFEA
jgi:hypothetical protein